MEAHGLWPPWAPGRLRFAWPEKVLIEPDLTLSRMATSILLGAQLVWLRKGTLTKQHVLLGILALKGPYYASGGFPFLECVIGLSVFPSVDKTKTSHTVSLPPPTEKPPLDSFVYFHNIMTSICNT